MNNFEISEKEFLALRDQFLHHLKFSDDVFLAIVKEYGGDFFGVVDGEPVPCENIDKCKNCDLNKFDRSNLNCAEVWRKWVEE